MDIVANRVNHTPESHIEVIHQPAGDAWGGTKVNVEFKNAWKRSLEIEVSQST